jgi:transposase
MSKNDQVILVGIDWADKLHAFEAIDPNGKRQHGSFKQSQAEVAKFIEAFTNRFPGARMLICIETTRGALINALMEHNCVEIFSVNPAALASYRKSFKHGGGKNDSVDAKLILKYLQNYRSELRPLIRNSAETRELETLTIHRRHLVDERVALGNRLQSLLKLYFPTIIELKPTDIHAKFVVALLRKYPSLEKVQAAGRAKLRALFFATGTKAKLETRVETLMTAKPITSDKVVINTSSRLCQCLAVQIELLNKTIKGYDAEIKLKVMQHADYDIVKELPGIGDKSCARIIASLGDDRGRYRTVEAFQAAAGIAPLTIQSGNSLKVSARWAATKYIKQTFHEYAGLSIAQCEWAKAYYDLQLSRGKSKQMAKRALAYKWIRIIYRCWQNHQPYNEAHYLKRLQVTHSPLAKKAG